MIHKAAVAAGALLETPAEARRRAAAGRQAPPHYTPVAPSGGERPVAKVANPYK